MRSKLPSLSIIIPVYNEQKRIKEILSALINQSYSKDLTQIIVVDNNSTDDTRAVVASFPVRLFTERRQNADAARNLGIKNSSGEVVAFIDADCVPDQEWAKKGVEALLDEDADLIAGGIRFSYQKKSAGELYDSITNLQHSDSVRVRGVAFTANLFVRRSVFETIGMLYDAHPAGADFIFTRKATSVGFKLKYCPQASVVHPARGMVELLKKAHRIGWEKAQHPKEGIRRGNLRRIFIRPHIRNLSYRVIKERLVSADISAGWGKKISIQFCGLAYIFSGVIGMAKGKMLVACRWVKSFRGDYGVRNGEQIRA